MGHRTIRQCGVASRLASQLSLGQGRVPNSVVRRIFWRSTTRLKSCTGLVHFSSLSFFFWDTCFCTLDLLSCSCHSYAASMSRMRLFVYALWYKGSALVHSLSDALVSDVPLVRFKNKFVNGITSFNRTRQLCGLTSRLKFDGPPLPSGAGSVC